jgi:hypothetical protein
LSALRPAPALRVLGPLCPRASALALRLRGTGYDAFAGRRNNRSAAAAPARRGRDGRRLRTLIDFFHEQPSPTIGHADRARGSADRARRADRLQQRDLPRTDAQPACQVDSNEKICGRSLGSAAGSVLSATLQHRWPRALLRYITGHFRSSSIPFICRMAPTIACRTGPRVGVYQGVGRASAVDVLFRNQVASRGERTHSRHRAAPPPSVARSLF